MKLVAWLASFLLLLSCNNSETDDLLARPPFNGLTDSISLSPQAASLYYRRGTLLYANNRPDLAEKDIRKAWTLSPKEPFALSLTTLLKNRDENAAVAFLEQATHQLPASIALSMELAGMYYDKDEADKANLICDNVIARYPTNLDALVLKSDILYDMDSINKAMDLLEKAYQYAPDDADIIKKLAFRYAEQKNLKVMALADTLISADTKGSADPYFFKGYYYEKMNDPQKAIRYFDEAIQHDYNFLDAYLHKGQVLYNDKSYNEAAQTFNLVLRIRPNTAEAYYWLARTGEAMGAKDEARLNYQRAYALDSSIKEAAAGAERLQ